MKQPKKEEVLQPAEPDQFHGQGGAYEIDPATGARRLVHRTQLPQPAAPTETKE